MITKGIQPVQKLLFPLKKTVLGILLCGAMMGCNYADDAVQIEGSIKNIRQAELFLISDMGATQRIDTIYVKDGEYSYQRKLTEGEILTLLFPNYYALPIVAYPGDELRIKSDATHLAQTIVKGSVDNELLTDFRIAMEGKSEEEQSLAAQQFIYDNVTTQAAIVLFRRYFVQQKDIVVAETMPLLDTLTKVMPDNVALRGLSQLVQLRMQTHEGQSIPNMEEVTMAGDTVRTEQFLGKPTVFTFWASWTKDHRTFVRTMSQLERDFADKVNFLHVSLDASRKNVRSVLRYDTLTAPVVCDQEALSSPLMSAFGINQVPQILIADKDGKFLKKDVSVHQLKDELNKIVE